MNERRVVRLVDPTTAPQPARFVPAPRLETLRGRRFGLLDNGKHRSETLLRAVGAALEWEWGAQLALVVRKPSAFQPAPPPLLDELRRVCDFVVTGVGD